MIFVSVGTHHAPFDRLLQAVDALAAELDEPVCVQHGVSRLALEHCAAAAWLAPDEVRRRMTEARVVVVHAGSSTFLEARALGRTPIVVPRRPEHGEHVDGHQVRFAAHLQAQGEAVVLEPTELGAAVASWREPQRPPQDRSAVFAVRLGALIDGLL